MNAAGAMRTACQLRLAVLLLVLAGLLSLLA